MRAKRRKLSTPGSEPPAAEAPELPERWSAARKTELVLRLLRGDALAAVEDFDSRRGQARVDPFVEEGVGDGVVMVVEGDVVVDVDASELPFGVHERRGGQRPQRRLIQALEQLATTGAVASHGAGVEIGQELRDPGVEGGE